MSTVLASQTRTVDVHDLVVVVDGGSTIGDGNRHPETRTCGATGDRSNHGDTE